MTLNSPSSWSLKLHVKMVTDTMMGSIEVEYENHPWAIDWQHDL